MGTIPDHATKVFEGMVFDVYQWQQKMFDGSIQTFESLKRADAAIVVALTSDGKVLTIIDVQPNRGAVITFPGGSVDHGETPLEAARRELMEETGYSSKDWELWGSYGAGPKVDCEFHYFIARNIVKAGEPTSSPGEKIELRLVDLDQMLDDIVSGKHVAHSFGAEILRQLAAGKRRELMRRLSNR